MQRLAHRNAPPSRERGGYRQGAAQARHHDVGGGRHRAARATAIVALGALALVGCSSSGGTDASTTTAAHGQTTTTAAEATTTAVTTTAADEDTTTTAADDGSASGDVPSYEDAKRVYLAQADDTTKATCAAGSEDRDVNVSSGTYTRFKCGGMEVFEYIEGADNYDENWPTISSESVYRSVFQIPGELIVVPSGSNDDFAPALSADCSCGEVVKQTG